MFHYLCNVHSFSFCVFFFFYLCFLFLLCLFDALLFIFIFRKKISVTSKFLWLSLFWASDFWYFKVNKKQHLRKLWYQFLRYFQKSLFNVRQINSYCLNSYCLLSIIKYYSNHSNATHGQRYKIPYTISFLTLLYNKSQTSMLWPPQNFLL